MAIEARDEDGRRRRRRELRYVFLTDETPETIRFLYRVWSLPLERFATLGPPAER